MTDSVNAQDFDPALTGTQTVQVQEAINEALRRRITEDLAADSEIQNRLFGEDTDWKATTLALQKRVVDLERLRELSAVVAAKPTEYPRKDGDVLVLGPELISTPDGSVLNWKGQNYVPQKERNLQPPLKEYKLGEVVEVIKDGDWLKGHITSIERGSHFLDVHTERGPVTAGSSHKVRKV